MDSLYKKVKRIILVVGIVIALVSCGPALVAFAAPAVSSAIQTARKPAVVIYTEKKNPSTDDAAPSSDPSSSQSLYGPYYNQRPTNSSVATSGANVTKPPVTPAAPVQPTTMKTAVVAPPQPAPAKKPGQPVSQSAEDKEALATLRGMGLSDAEVAEAWYIHEHESVSWTGVNQSSGCYGGWQLKLSAHPDVTEAEAFDPVQSTKYAVKYMTSRYGSVSQAYLHKIIYTWY